MLSTACPPVCLGRKVTLLAWQALSDVAQMSVQTPCYGMEASQNIIYREEACHPDALLLLVRFLLPGLMIRPRNASKKFFLSPVIYCDVRGVWILPLSSIFVQ